MKVKSIISIAATLIALSVTSCKKDSTTTTSTQDTASDIVNLKDDNTGTGTATTSTSKMTSPVNGATNVPLSQVVSVTFNSTVTSTQLAKATLVLQKMTSTSKDDSKSMEDGSYNTIVPGTLSISGSTLSFKPNAPLAINTIYKATATTSTTQKDGRDCQKNGYSWSFTTGAGSTSLTPSVTTADPMNGATGVAFNKAISVTFSEPMNPTTINATTFTVKQGTTAVAGTVTYSGSTAVFTPSAALIPNTVYTVTMGTGAMDMTGMAMMAPYSFSFTTAAALDVTPPTIISVDPANAATGVLTSKVIAVNFSESMNASTISGSTITVKQGTTAVAGTVAYSGTKATFTPSAALANNTVYTISVSTGVKDVAGNAMVSAFTSTFTTAALADVTPPTVSSVDPLNNATGVATNKVISINFSEALTASTVSASTITVKQGSTAVAGAVAYSGTKATFTPSAALAASTLYTVTVTTGIKDLAGNAMAANYSFSFTTAAPVDVTPPTVSSTTPAANATGVALTQAISATFSEALTASTINSSTFTVKQGTTAVAGTVTLSGNTATFTPSAALTGSTVYTVTLTTGIKDLAGNAMAAANTWSFTTAAPALSFANDVMPVLAQCEACHTHGWTPSTDPSTYWNNLKNAGYINPANYTTSTIYIKLGTGHPGSAAIPTASTDKIINWMKAGSLNN